MSNELTKINQAPMVLDQGIIANLVTKGDLRGLTAEQKVAFYNYRCQQAGLDPSAKPFDLLVLNGKEVLYANASCTQQLCNLWKLSVAIVGRERVDDLYLVHARVSGPDGRSTENMGSVPLGGLKGEALSNALMKATTKAIRRAVLAHCGLGMLDETEAETIPQAVKRDFSPYPADMQKMDQLDAATIARDMLVYIEAAATPGDENAAEAWAIKGKLPDDHWIQVHAMFNTKQKERWRKIEAHFAKPAEVAA